MDTIINSDMKKFTKLILMLVVVAIGLQPVYSQRRADFDEDEWEFIQRYLMRVDTVMPQQYPVIGIGTGFFNYYGNVSDAFRSFTVGKPGFSLNLATVLGKKNQNFRGNFTFMTGELTGTQRTVDDNSLYKNLNFKSDIYSLGINVLFSPRTLLNNSPFEPFVALGVSMLSFDSKTDYYFNRENSIPYHYWTDGTIRDAPQTPNNWNANIIPRNYGFDDNLRRFNRTGLGEYSQFALTVPVDVGFDFRVSPRVTLRAGTSMHYVFSDLIDDLSSRSERPEYRGKRGNSMFTYSYLSLHFDFFSTEGIDFTQLVFSEIEIDWALYEDEDEDGVADLWDLCPGTPWDWEVDENGCPLDRDGDGVPDELDHEPDSRPGAIVDENGVEMTEEMIIASLDMQAIRRSEVEAYLTIQRAQRRTRRAEPLPIPQKFRHIDVNNDGYISYDEVIRAISDFLEGSSTLTHSDLIELNEFFFEQ